MRVEVEDLETPIETIDQIRQEMVQMIVLNIEESKDRGKNFYKTRQKNNLINYIFFEKKTNKI